MNLAWIALFSLALSAQTLDQLQPVHVNVNKITFKGRAGVRVTQVPAERAAETMAILKDVDFEDGIIELDLAGDLARDAGAGARGFVGIAFRVTDPATYECIYLRPTNGRADDQLRRNHSVQYISHPAYTWDRLRKENPSEFETYVDLQPAEWIKVKIEVRGDRATLWVNGAEQPTLIVKGLKHGKSRGGVALWIGPGTEAHFANLKITK